SSPSSMDIRSKPSSCESRWCDRPYLLLASSFFVLLPAPLKVRAVHCCLCHSILFPHCPPWFGHFPHVILVRPVQTNRKHPALRTRWSLEGRRNSPRLLVS